MRERDAELRQDMNREFTTTRAAITGLTERLSRVETLLEQGNRPDGSNAARIDPGEESRNTRALSFVPAGFAGR